MAAGTSRQPSYEKVFLSLKNKIMNNEYEVGSFLPPEHQLEEIYDVSRTTIRKAVENLAHEGFVVVSQGRGTEVLDYVTMQNLNVVSSFSKTLSDKGYVVTSKAKHIDLYPADHYLSESLGVKEGVDVVRVQRIQLANEKPIAIITNYLPYDIGDILLENETEFVSLYQHIEEEKNIVLDSSYDRITARSADFAKAQMIEVPVGTALIKVKRICYAGSRAVSVDELYINGEMYEFEVNLLDRAHT